MTEKEKKFLMKMHKKHFYITIYEGKEFFGKTSTIAIKIINYINYNSSSRSTCKWLVFSYVKKEE